MKCIKCGKDTAGSDVFCEECLADMELHPVKPGTPILLPPREQQPAAKRSRKRQTRPEAKISSLKATIRWLLVAIMVLVIAFTMAVTMLLHLLQQNDNSLAPGQNYQTSQSAN